MKNKLLLFSIFLILFVTLMPGNGKIAGDYLDKVVHFLIFLFLSINLCFSFQDAGRKLWIGIVLAVLFGFVTEFLQQFVPGRNMDLIDGIADTLGVLIGLLFYRRNPIVTNKLLMKFGSGVFS